MRAKYTYVKKTLLILAGILGSVLLALGVALAALAHPRVQTKVLGWVTEEVSRMLGAEAHVEHIAFRLPARLSVSGVYVEDLQQDTLLYVDQLHARLSVRSLIHREIRFREINLSTVRAYAHRTEDGEYNYQFLVDALSRNDKPIQLDALLSAERVVLDDIRGHYDDHEVELAHAEIGLRCLSKDSVDAQIGTLRAAYWRTDKPSERLCVEDLAVHLIANDTIVAMPQLMVVLPHSELDISGLNVASPRGALRDPAAYASDIHATLHITRANIRPRDLAVVLPPLGKVDQSFAFSADVHGTLDSLYAHNLSFFYDARRVVQGDVLVLGMPERDSMYVRASCNDLFVNAGLIQDFLSDMNDAPFVLPQEVRRLGDVHYRGLLSGRLGDLTLHGAFSTAIGAITTDGRLLSDSAFANLDFSGKVATRRFQLGTMLGNNDLGALTLSVETDGHLREGKGVHGTVHGHVSEFSFRGYKYHDLCLNGRFGPHNFEGDASIEDDNVDFRFAGLADFTRGQENMNFDIMLRHLRPGPLHLSDKYHDAEVAFNAYVNLEGLDPDHMSGYFVIDSLLLCNGQDTTMMKQFKLVAEHEDVAANDCHKSLKVTSDYLTARFSGHYSYRTFLTSLVKQAISYLPGIFPADYRRKVLATPTNNDFNFYIYGRELRELQRVLDLPVRVSDYPVIKGFIDDSRSMWGLQAYVPYFFTGAQRLDNITFSFDNADAMANLGLRVQLASQDVTLRAAALHDTLSVDVGLRSPDMVNGDLHMMSRFSQYAGMPLIDTEIRPSMLSYGDSIYTINAGRISYCAADTLLAVDNFRVGGASQFVEASGVASPRSTDSLFVQLGHIDAGYIISFLLPDNVLTVQGDLSGWAKLYGLFSQPVFSADVSLQGAGLNGAILGDVTANVALEEGTNHILIDGMVQQPDGEGLVATVGGLVKPEEHRWQIDVLPEAITLAFINHWTAGIIDDISGHASGRVSIFGHLDSTWVSAAVYAEDAALTIPYTGCRYHFSDSAFLDSTSIRFPNMTLYDEENHPIDLNGAINHQLFQTFGFDIDVTPHHAMAFNLPSQKGEMLAGKVYADGHVMVRGDDKLVRLMANAKTVGPSWFQFNISTASNASENNFITFVDHHTVKIRAKEDELADLLPKGRKLIEHPKTDFQMSLNVEGTPDLLFRLVLNDRTGDMIQARGEGGLSIGYVDRTGDISLVGTYTLIGGSLGFTVGNVIRRDFTIAEGSQLVWSGKPENPVLDVTAKYHVVASLRDLFGEEISTLTTSRTSIPINTCLTLRGTLDDASIKFGLELPSSEDVIEAQVRSVINTDEMLMRQVVYLLVFGRFFTPDYMRRTGTAGLNEVYSLLSSTVTGQINSWLGKLTDVFSMGINIRTEGEGAGSSQEYEAQFTLQPVNRLIINGNIGYRYNDVSNRPIFGDVDVEYLLTSNGKLRAKAYTHTVDKYSLRQASTIQGVGFVFKHDFNWPERKRKPSVDSIPANSPSDANQPEGR